MMCYLLSAYHYKPILTGRQFGGINNLYGIGSSALMFLYNLSVAVDNTAGQWPHILHGQHYIKYLPDRIWIKQYRIVCFGITYPDDFTVCKSSVLVNLLNPVVVDTFHGRLVLIGIHVYRTGVAQCRN